MRGLTKSVGTAAAVVFVAYLLILPLFWPAPKVTASMPEVVSLREDPEIPIVVKAWHSNIQVVQVRFYVDYHASTAKGAKGLLNPAVLYEESPSTLRGILGRNILTRPCRKRLAVTVPLGDFARQELLGEGLLVGKLDVTVNYAMAGMRHGDRTRARTAQVMRSVPFRWTVTE